MSDKAMLVLGEASESDDEDHQQEVNKRHYIVIMIAVTYIKSSKQFGITLKLYFQIVLNDGNGFANIKIGIVESDQTESDKDSSHHVQTLSIYIRLLFFFLLFCVENGPLLFCNVMYYYCFFLYKGNRISRTKKVNFTGHTNHYKMSEDTLLHRKLSKYLVAIKLLYHLTNNVFCRRKTHTVLFQLDGIQ